MSGQHPSVHEVVEYGLDRISPERTVSVSVRELVRLFRAFDELNAFFHQPSHYPDLNAVQSFLGSRADGGAYSVISQALTRSSHAFFPTTFCRTLSRERSNTPSLSPIDKPDRIAT